MIIYLLISNYYILLSISIAFLIFKAFFLIRCIAVSTDLTLLSNFFAKKLDSKVKSVDTAIQRIRKKALKIKNAMEMDNKI